MAANAQRLLSSPHLNRGLFSDYYLNEIVPKMPVWDAIFDEAIVVRDQLRDLLATISPDNLDEAQLEKEWVQPVLEALGHHYFVQFKIRYRQRGFRKPDYVLMNSTDDARQMDNRIYEPSEISHALALADAKKWGINFDKSQGHEGNPSQQIDEYLRYSELTWGILTDGRYWRLYENSTSKFNRFYAVDLMELLGHTEKIDDFLYFYLFFRREAFVADGWLEEVLDGSTEFARKLSDDLEDQIYDALEAIAQGYLQYRRNRLQPRPETLREIYTQSLVLLYRLLFVFYAESRAVLPVKREFKSMSALRQKAATQVERGMAMHPDDSEYYMYLNDLFFAIDQGDPVHDIPAYNGRLFSERDHEFLAQNFVGSAFMAQAIDLMGRVAANDNGKKRVNVDYRDLDVRHLGAIYEKLLDYELDLAETDLALKSGKYVKAGATDTVVKRKGEVYLRTGNHERKITGSYYTPDYIVRFIVERTLRPLLERITGQYAEQDSEDNWQVKDAQGLVDAILGLNILDPAIGSGHFLVDVTAYIAEWLRDLRLAPDDTEEDDELIYWKRQVVSACIYGVDVNPLAVELAKLSLWLATIGEGKPLSFLDHHLRVGNSLVGARTVDVGVKWKGILKAAEQNGEKLPLFEADENFSNNLGLSVGLIHGIETTIADSVEEVKQQEELYEVMRAYVDPYIKLADVWTARYFGVTIDPPTWRAVQEYVLYDKSVVAGVDELVEQAQTLADTHHFFHWDLIFPEIFFTPQGELKADAGFDAVVGNPPYVRQERIMPYKPFFETHYEVYSGTADLFLYFYELGLRFLKDAQKLGFVTSGTYMNSNSAKAFRKYIHENAGFEAVVNFGENQPFRGAEMVYPTIAVLHKGQAAETFRSHFMEGTTIQEDLSEVLAEDGINCLSSVTALPEWRFQSVELTRLFQKLTEGYATLNDVVGGRIYSGIKTGLNEVFVINDEQRLQLIKEDSKSAEVIKPILRGQDMRPWYQQSNDLYLIFMNSGVEIGRYPAIMNYLEQHRRQLEPKPDNWTSSQGKWTGRAAGNYEWYELQASVSYADMFERAKICWPDISKLPRFSWNEGTYLINTGFMIGDPTISTLALLQSRPIWFAISQIAQPLRLRAGLWQYRNIVQFVERLPIPELTTKQESDLAALAEEITGLARERYQLHEAVRGTLLDNFEPQGKLNQKLTAWWDLDFPTFLEEVPKALKVEVPLGKQGEWKAFLGDEQTKHGRLTAAIVDREERLNGIVYKAFGLDADEIGLIEKTTKYPYGAV